MAVVGTDNDELVAIERDCSNESVAVTVLIDLIPKHDLFLGDMPKIKW